MPLLNDVHSIIVSASSATLSAYSFTEIYAAAAATPIVNGVQIAMAAGSSIKIKVNDISNSTGCFLLGEKINNTYDNPSLNG